MGDLRFFGPQPVTSQSCRTVRCAVCLFTYPFTLPRAVYAAWYRPIPYRIVAPTARGLIALLNIVSYCKRIFDLDRNKCQTSWGAIFGEDLSQSSPSEVTENSNKSPNKVLRNGHALSTTDGYSFWIYATGLHCWVTVSSFTFIRLHKALHS